MKVVLHYRAVAGKNQVSYVIDFFVTTVPAKFAVIHDSHWFYCLAAQEFPGILKHGIWRFHSPHRFNL